jgi:AAA15 family ATPase/GTPase
VFSTLRIEGYRSIEDSGSLELGPITLLVGRNNTGKSAVLRSAFLMQEGSGFREEDIRIGASQVSIHIAYD